LHCHALHSAMVMHSDNRLIQICEDDAVSLRAVDVYIVIILHLEQTELNTN
jgi:hypothetical protein